MSSEAVVHLSVVIPAFEEAGRLDRTLRRVRAYLDEQSFSSEVLVVVDGGGDGTLELVRKWEADWSTLRALDNKVNQGKGFAVRRGMLVSRGRYLLFSDADLSTPIDQVEHLLVALEAGGDVAIGSRARTDTWGTIPRIRFVSSLSKPATTPCTNRRTETDKARPNNATIVTKERWLRREPA